jgi:hypothetical protein
MRLPVETHVFDIPQRLREIDPALRVLFNTDKQTYEVWGRDLHGPYLMASFHELDQRVLTAVRRGYYMARSTGMPYHELLREQEQIDYRAEQARFQRLRDIEYGIRDDLKFMGRPVVPGATF